MRLPVCALIHQHQKDRRYLKGRREQKRKGAVLILMNAHIQDVHASNGTTRVYRPGLLLAARSEGMMRGRPAVAATI